MTHPEELLAGYVDGTLSSGERATVHAHLAGCPRCRGEVSLATRARSALGSLTEVPAPAGIASRALEESRGGGVPAAGGGTSRWYRVAGIAAAAAALLVFALNVPHVGQSDDAGTAARPAAAGTGAAGNAEALKSAGIEIQHANYDNESLSALSASYVRDSAAAGGGAETTSGPNPEFAATQGTQRQTADALACIQTSAPDATGGLIRLIRARFQGVPAYLAVFLEGPGFGQPDDAVNVWVFGTSDCAILSYSHAKL